MNVSSTMCRLRSLVVVVATTVVIAGAYRNEREVVSFSAATSPYHKSRSTRNFFFNQPFVETTIDQHRTPSHIPVRDRTVSQQALRHVSTKEQSVYSPSFPIYSHRPFKQSSFHMVTTFRDEPSSLRDAPFSKNQESRGRPARLFRNSPLGGQSAPFVASEEILEEEASAYRSRGPSRKQLFTTEAPFKNLFHAQSSAGGRTPSFQEEAAFVESPVRDSMKFHRDDSYDKPIDSYGRQKNSETVPYERPSMYMEYDDHAPGLSSSMPMPPMPMPSMPMIPSSKDAHPSYSKEMPAPPSSTSPPSMPAAREQTSSPSVSSVSSGVSGVRSSEDIQMKLSPVQTLQSATPTSAGKCNTPVDNPSTRSSDAVTTVPSISISTNQSSAVDHILTSLTTRSSSPVMTTANPIAPFVGNTLGPIHFHATKYGAVASPIAGQNEVKSNEHPYLLSETPSSGLKMDEYNFKYRIPEMDHTRHNVEIGIRGSTLNSILSEGLKSGLKTDIQNSFANYALPEVLKHSWPLQQFSQLETSSSYTPLSPDGKLKFILPSLPVASASAITWPIETKRDVSLMLPTRSILASDGVAGDNLPLGLNLPSDFIAGIPNSLTRSISNSISGGISTGIPAGMTADMLASAPTLNLGQSLHRAEQLRQTQEARNPWYPTGWNGIPSMTAVL